jgi:hypothetical protein
MGAEQSSGNVLVIEALRGHLKRLESENTMSFFEINVLDPFGKKAKLAQIKDCSVVVEALEKQADEEDSLALAKAIQVSVDAYKKSPKEKHSAIADEFYSILNRNRDALLKCASVKELQKKNNIDAFKQNEIQFSDDIAKHSGLLYKRIYSKKHVLDQTERTLHGIEHVNRVAYDIPVLINLYKLAGDKSAAALTNEDLKLLQIAALFHDTGRQSDTGKDYWDKDSAELAYYYLVDTLKMPKEKAQKVAEAIMNKDYHEGETYYRLRTNAEGELTWEMSNKGERNIYQKILHDADSLDIIRARKIYDGKRLEFYHDYASKDEKSKELLSELICEQRSLIELQGDGFKRQDAILKKEFENEEGYARTVQLVQRENKANNHFRLLSTLYTTDLTIPVKTLSTEKSVVYNPEAPLDEKNLRAALDQGLVLSRGISEPTARVTKTKKGVETQAELEVRKTLRRKGVGTRTAKSDRFEKHGNLNRSVAMLGHGAPSYTSAGFGIIEKDKSHKRIKSVASENIFSGFGKKKVVNVKAMPTSEEKENALKAVHEMQRMGGGSEERKSTHSEIIADLEDYDFIYFTKDPVFACSSLVPGSDVAKAFHPNAPLLQAIYLQLEYQKQSGSKKLFLVEYSGIHNTINIHPDLSEKEIIHQWKTMCIDFIRKQTSENKTQLLSMNLDQVKIYSMYGSLQASVGSIRRDLESADTHFRVDMRKEIDSAVQHELEQAKQKMTEKMIADIKSGAVPLFSEAAVSFLRSLGKGNLPPDLAAFVDQKLSEAVAQNEPYELTKKLFSQTISSSKRQPEKLPETLTYFSAMADITSNTSLAEKIHTQVYKAASNTLLNNLDNLASPTMNRRWYLMQYLNLKDAFHFTNDDHFFKTLLSKLLDIPSFYIIEKLGLEKDPQIMALMRQILMNMDFSYDDFLGKLKWYGAVLSNEDRRQRVNGYIEWLINHKERLAYVSDIEKILKDFNLHQDDPKLTNGLLQLMPKLSPNNFPVYVDAIRALSRIQNESRHPIDAATMERAIFGASETLLHYLKNLSDDQRKENYGHVGSKADHFAQFAQQLAAIDFNPPITLSPRCRQTLDACKHLLRQSKVEQAELDRQVTALFQKLGHPPAPTLAHTQLFKKQPLSATDTKKEPASPKKDLKI